MHDKNYTSIGIANLTNSYIIIYHNELEMFRRIKQGLNGRLFKTFRLFTTPVIYFLLLFFFMAAFIGNIYYITIVILLCGIGIIPGFIYGEHVSFFEKDKKIFYKRLHIYLLSGLQDFW